jgi:hypothetical protein
VGLMIEKYLKDSITDKARLAKIEQLSNLNLIPSRVYVEMRRQDSLLHSKDSAYLILKGYIKIEKDTLGIDEGDEEDAVDKMKDDNKAEIKKNKPAKDSNDKKINIKTEAILPDEKKKQELKDTIKPEG